VAVLEPGREDLTLEGPLAIGSVFRWKAGGASLTSTLRVVDPPRELSWSGRTTGIRAIQPLGMLLQVE